jgi:16S rRNA (guanine527-N7)-methyltransferase
MGINLYKYQILDQFNVSRETYYQLDYFKELVLEKNKKINLISRKVINNFIERHIIDCAQVIDFIDLNNKICTDLGSGAGLPGIVVAIILRDKKNETRMNLFEKSHRKSDFLREIKEKLKLDVNVYEKDVFKEKNLNSGSVIVRAFKPLPTILEIMEKNFINFSNLVVFMGKNGKQLVESSIKKWDFDYKKKRSITSKDSFLINIKNVKKNEQDRNFINYKPEGWSW